MTDTRTARELNDLSPDLRVRVAELIKACPYSLGITSAWRSREEQQRLYDGYKAGKPGFHPANPPGTSKHEDSGPNGEPASNACDLDYPDGSARAEAVQWVHRRAASFGLCFPIRREDWHAESNGRPYSPPQLSKELDVDEKTLRKIIGEEVDRRVTILLRGESNGKPTGHTHHLKSLGERLARIEQALGSGQ